MRRTQRETRRAAAEPVCIRRLGRSGAASLRSTPRSVLALAAAGLAAVIATAATPAAADPPIADFDFGDDEEAAAARTLAGSATEGHVSLVLVPVDDGDRPADAPAIVFQVQRATRPDFSGAVVHHESAATAAFISGLEEGTHHFRVRGRELRDGEDGLTAGAGDAPADGDATDPGWGPWSDPAVFEVEHQPMSTAWLLFGIGFVLFASLVFIVLREAGDPHRGLRPDDGGRPAGEAAGA